MLIQGDEDSVHDFYCQDFYLRHAAAGEWLLFYDDKDSVGSKIKEPHYSVDIKNGFHIQSTIVPPYWVISKEETNKTTIYKFKGSIYHQRPEDLLLEIPLIVPSDYLPNEFARKIKNLVIFS